MTETNKDKVVPETHDYEGKWQEREQAKQRDTSRDDGNRRDNNKENEKLQGGRNHNH